MLRSKTGCLRLSGGGSVLWKSVATGVSPWPLLAFLARRPAGKFSKFGPTVCAQRRKLRLICMGRVHGGIVRIRCPGMKPPIGVGQAHREMLSLNLRATVRAFEGLQTCFDCLLVSYAAS